MYECYNTCYKMNRWMVHDEWYMMNMLLNYMIHYECYMMNAISHMTHKEWRMIHDEYVTTHDSMNYNYNNAQGHNEYYHYYQNNYHCLLTHNNPLFGWSHHWHTQPHRSSPNNLAVPASVVWCLLIWSGRRPWCYGRKRWRENEALVGYACTLNVMQIL